MSYLEDIKDIAHAKMTLGTCATSPEGLGLLIGNLIKETQGEGGGGTLTGPFPYGNDSIAIRAEEGCDFVNTEFFGDIYTQAAHEERGSGIELWHPAAVVIDGVMVLEDQRVFRIRYSTSLVAGEKARHMERDFWSTHDSSGNRIHESV